MQRRGWTTDSGSAILQIQLYHPYFICGVGTRGSRDDKSSWVKKYDASFFSDAGCKKLIVSTFTSNNIPCPTGHAQRASYELLKRLNFS